MNGKRTLTSVGIAIVVLALVAGLAAAQGPEPPAEAVSAEEEVEAAAVVRDVLPIQGRLTDQSGNPLNGPTTSRPASMTRAAAARHCATIFKAVQVNNGLFTMSIPTARFRTSTAINSTWGSR